jgi:pre-mRNA-splicing factor 18
MDALKNLVQQVKSNEFEKKRKALDVTGSNPTTQQKKYVRRGDLARVEAQAYVNRSKERQLAASPSGNRDPSESADNSHQFANTSRRSTRGLKQEEEEEEEESLPSDDVIRRLRNRGQPIRLFGETDRARERRLREIEADVESRKGQRNEYARQLAKTEAGLEMEMLLQHQDALETATNGDSKEAQVGTHRKKEPSGLYKPEYDVTKLDGRVLGTDPDLCFLLVYVYVRRVLDEWENELQSRPDNIKRSTSGKHEYTKFVQTKDNLKPFFKRLKRKDVENDVMEKIADILRFAMRREYVKAYDCYLQLSIGNAPWPIGVTMVGYVGFDLSKFTDILNIFVVLTLHTLP